MDYINELMFQEKGKLEVHFDMNKLNFYAVITDRWNDPLVMAEGSTFEEVIYNLNEYCLEHLSKQ